MGFAVISSKLMAQYNLIAALFILLQYFMLCFILFIFLSGWLFCLPAPLFVFIFHFWHMKTTRKSPKSYIRAVSWARIRLRGALTVLINADIFNSPKTNLVFSCSFFIGYRLQRQIKGRFSRTLFFPLTLTRILEGRLFSLPPWRRRLRGQL